MCACLGRGVGNKWFCYIIGKSRVADVFVSHEVDVSPREVFYIVLDREMEETSCVFQSKRGVLHETGLRNGGNTLNLSV